MAHVKRKPDCHPERWHQAKGLCKNCYMKEWKRKKRRRLGIPIRRSEIKSHLVYLYYNLFTNQPIYVGEGTMDRAVSHKYPYRNSSWWNKELLLITMTCKDEWEALEYEGKWGGYYKPIKNVWGNRIYRPRQEKRVREGAN